MISYSPASHVDGSKASGAVGYEGNVQVFASKDVFEDIIALLVPEADISSFEHLIPRLSKPIGVSSLYFFPVVAQHVMLTLLSNLVVAT